MLGACFDVPTAAEGKPLDMDDASRQIIQARAAARRACRAAAR